MSPFETIESRFKDWNYGHPKILWGLIRAMKPDVVVEVGTYLGYAACYMAQALKENGHGKLYCIDNFSLTNEALGYGNPLANWRENIQACGVADWVELLIGNSDAVTWPDKVDLAYIDGWHSLGAASHDFTRCADRGAKMICMDDTLTCVGPRMLVEMIEGHSQDFQPFDGYLWQVVDVHSDGGLSIISRVRPKRKVEFIQERLNHPGVALQNASAEERAAAFMQATSETGLDYSKYL